MDCPKPYAWDAFVGSVGPTAMLPHGQWEDFAKCALRLRGDVWLFTTSKLPNLSLPDRSPLCALDNMAVGISDATYEQGAHCRFSWWLYIQHNLWAFSKCYTMPGHTHTRIKMCSLYTSRYQCQPLTALMPVSHTSFIWRVDCMSVFGVVSTAHKFVSNC